MTRVGGAPAGRALEMDGDLGFLCHCIKHHMSFLAQPFLLGLGFLCYQSRPGGVCEGCECQPVLDALK